MERVHCAQELIVIWSEQEHKGAGSLYFSIYRPSPLTGMYHSAFTFEKRGAPSSVRIHSEFRAALFNLNLPASSPEIDSACPFKPRRHPYRLLSAKEKKRKKLKGAKKLGRGNVGVKPENALSLSRSPSSFFISVSLL